MIDFIRGPMVWISFGVFFAGLAIQGFRFFSLTRRKTQSFLPFTGGKQIKKKTKLDRLREISAAVEVGVEGLRYSVLGVHPVMTVVTVIFHFSLFLVPIFLLAHNTMLEDSWGFGLPSFPDYLADLMTFVFLCCGAFFLFRRLFFRRVRVVTSLYDYLVLLVTLAPFVTGFFAYHHWFNYRIMLHAHVVAGELMLITVPFTKLRHMIYFFLYRFWLGGEYGFGQGKRVW